MFVFMMVKYIFLCIFEVNFVVVFGCDVDIVVGEGMRVYSCLVFEFFIMRVFGDFVYYICC